MSWAGSRRIFAEPALLKMLLRRDRRGTDRAYQREVALP
jgi:hypothetical protein